MRTTPEPDSVPTGLGPRVTPPRPQPAVAPRAWAPLPKHPGYESDGSSVRRVDPPRFA
jgi:hypothetical protein